MRAVAVLVIAAACKSSESLPPSSSSGSALPPARLEAGTDANPLRDAAVHEGPAEPDESYRWFRGEATIDKLGSVPFIFGVHHTRQEGVLWSPEERLPFLVLQRDPLHIRIPVRGIELRFQAGDTAERLHGTWDVSYFHKRDFPIVAVPIEAPRAEALFGASEAPAFDASGGWRIDIHSFGVGRGTFRQDAGGNIVGAIIPPEVGDLRYLTGRTNGNRVQLQAYDGMHGFYIDMASRDGGKTLDGTWLIAGIGKMKLKATRGEVPPTHVRVSAKMAPGKTRLSLPQLDQPPYKGNPVIVDYFGSWCPVCIDLTPELVRLQREHAASGLQVLSIALEPPGDEVEARRRLDEFRAQFGMSWPFQVVFTDDFNGAVVPEIVDATGFPVTAFLRRDHTVAAVHTGFVSKAAGAEHDAAVKLIESYIQQIVARPPAP